VPPIGGRADGPAETVAQFRRLDIAVINAPSSDRELFYGPTWSASAARST